MYRLGKRHRRSKKPYIIGSLVMLILGASFGGYQYLVTSAKSSTAISNSAASTHYVSASSSQKTHFDEGIFSLDLPRAWKLANQQTPPASAYNVYTFQGTTALESSRLISVYVDLLPTTMAVNRSIAVQAQGSGLSHGIVSDNCINFTGQAARNTPEAINTAASTSRWDSVDFLCDLGNYNRNVTGTSSIGNINKVTLAGSLNGTHSFFIVYTDVNINPDYTVLYSAIDSFKLK
jgi:hypothetical protein